MRMMIKSREMMTVIMRWKGVFRRKIGRERMAKSIREDCEQCDRGQTERERKDSPFGFLLSLSVDSTYSENTHTHTDIAVTARTAPLTVCGQLMSVQFCFFFFLPSADGHDRMFIRQCQAHIQQPTNTTVLAWKEVKKDCCYLNF